MDVGGGNGEVLLAALAAHTALRGRILDLPHVVERAADQIAASGVSARCESVGGSFFDRLPGGADAILLCHILHDWSEDKALQIITRCREALAPGGTLLIAEALIEEADHLTVPIRLDLAMMTYYNGAERTLEEYHGLVGKAGFEITGVVPVTPALSILEAKAD